MNKKANRTAIGAFVFGAAILLVSAIALFGSKAIFKTSDKYVLYFNGSVKGLSVGAPVIFRGVKIGSVNNISIVYNPQIKDVLIPVIIDVELSLVKGAPEKLGYPDYKMLINRGLQARLEIQNFITNQLMISLDFYPDKPVQLHGFIKEYPELPTLPISPDIFELVNELPVKQIAKDLEGIVAGVNKLVNSEGFYDLSSAIQEIAQAARNMRLFFEYLEQHPEAILKGKSGPERRMK